MGKQRRGKRAYLKRRKVVPTYGWAQEYYDRVRSLSWPTEPGKTVPYKPADPRMEVELKLERLRQTDFHQGIDRFNNVVLARTKHYCLRLYFSGMEYFFIKEDHIQKIAYKSFVYYGRERAMKRLRQDRVVWISTFKLAGGVDENGAK